MLGFSIGGSPRGFRESAWLDGCAISRVVDNVKTEPNLNNKDVWYCSSIVRMGEIGLTTG